MDEETKEVLARIANRLDAIWTNMPLGMMTQCSQYARALRDVAQSIRNEIEPTKNPRNSPQ